MSGRLSRSKGNRVERAMVRLFQDRGYAAEKTSRGGAANGRTGSDLSVPVLGVEQKVECKARKDGDGFKRLYEWLGEDNFALIVKADRRPPLLVIPLSRAIDVLDVAERRRTK